MYGPPPRVELVEGRRGGGGHPDPPPPPRGRRRGERRGRRRRGQQPEALLRGGGRRAEAVGDRHVGRTAGRFPFLPPSPLSRLFPAPDPAAAGVGDSSLPLLLGSGPGGDRR
jgi:hypothetical protein